MKIYWLAFMLMITTVLRATERATCMIHPINESEWIEGQLANKFYKLHEVHVVVEQLHRLNFHLSTMVVKRPTPDEPYYIVDVGHSGIYRFETRYEFKIMKVDVNKIDIKPYVAVWDGFKGDYLPLYKYRKIHRPK